jgi:hypothetical protein
MKPPPLRAMKRAVMLMPRSQIAHRPDLMRQFAVMLLRGAKRDIELSPQEDEPSKVK